MNPNDEHKGEIGTSSRTEFSIDKIKVGHNRAEGYIVIDHSVVILPLSAMKSLCHELVKAIDLWENEHGRIDEPPSRKDSLPRRVVKSLYKSRKIAPKLTSINTKRRKRQ